MTRAAADPAVIKPLPLRYGVLFFAVPSAIVTLFLFAGIDRMRDVGAGPFLMFNLMMVLPLGLMFVAAFVAYGLERRPWMWSAFRDRMRLGTMGWSGWIWSVALAVFMFQPLGTPRLAISLAFAGLAIGVERGFGRAAIPSLAGVFLFVASVWALPSVIPTLRGVAFYASPAWVTWLLVNVTPTTFMGIELSGQWWVIAYYLGVVMLVNIVGEELWWRGYILPRQELVHGRWTWVIHGTLWTLFHIFQTPDLGEVAIRLPGMLALAYVCQRQGSTWPGIIGHFVGNSPFLIVIATGVLN